MHHFTLKNFVQADFSTPISALLCGCLGSILFLIPINWFWDLDDGSLGLASWLIIGLCSGIWATLVLISNHRPRWFIYAGGYALILTILVYLYSRRFVDGMFDGAGVAIAVSVLLILPFALLNRPLSNWNDPKALVVSLAGLIRQAIGTFLGLGIFWALYLAIAGLLYLAGIRFLFEEMTVSWGFGMSGLIGGACFVVSARVRPLIVGFEALFWVARVLAPILALMLTGLAVPLIAQIGTLLGSNPSGTNSGVGLAATFSLVLSLLPLIGASLERDQTTVWPLWLRVSTLWLVASALLISTLLAILSFQEFLAFGLTPYRLFSFGIRASALIGIALMLGAFWHGQQGLQRGIWALVLAILLWCLSFISPLVNAEAWSAQNLIDRLRNDQGTELRDYQIVSLDRRWGKAGAAGLDIIEAESLMPSRLGEENSFSLNPYLASIARSIEIYPLETDPGDWFDPGDAAYSSRGINYRSQILKEFSRACVQDCYGFVGDWVPTEEGDELLTIVLEGSEVSLEIWGQTPTYPKVVLGYQDLEYINGNRDAAQRLINALKSGTAVLAGQETPLIKTPAGILQMP